MHQPYSCHRIDDYSNCLPFLGLSEGKDDATLALYREAELKHGRVAMLAVTGYLVQSQYQFPGDLNGIPFSEIPNGVAAIGVVPSLGWLQITASIGYWELVGWEDKRASDAAGDFGFGANFFTEEAKEKNQFALKELQNGRLAMLAILELVTHDLAKPAGEGLFTLHHF